jgi:hypothetical protein
MHRAIPFFKKYFSHTTTILFVAGFLFDMVMLPDIEDAFARYVGGGYLIAIALLIMFREFIVSQNRASKIEQKLYTYSTFGISYFSGSALSFVCVYTLRSAAFSVSWPLFALLFLLIVANEYISTHNYRFTLDIGVWLVAMLFYCIYNTPLILNVQSDTTFVISIGVALVIALGYLYLLQFTSDSAADEAPKNYALALGVPMFVGMLYFLNVLPAVPLSLKDQGIYHVMSRNDAGDFVAEKEEDTRMFLYFRDPVYHLSPNDTGAYFFSAVNAPYEISAPLSHVWEYYDEKNHKWVEAATIPFTLAGGRESGYRAYSYKEGVTEGLWRVLVMVDSKRIVGRLRFRVKKADTTTPLTGVTL